MARRGGRFRYEMGVAVHAYNRTAAGLRAAASQVRSFASQISTQAGYTAGALGAATAGMTAGLTAAAGAVILFGKEGLGEFAKLETKIIEVKTLLGDLETDTGQMMNSVQNLSQVTGRAGEDLAAGWYTAISAGVDFNESLIVVGESSIGATAGLTDLETATQASAAGMNAFGETARSTQDKAFAAVKLGVVRYEEIAGAVGKFAGTGAAANLELSEMLSGLTTLTVQGVKSEEGIVQINNAVNQLLKSGSQVGQLFQRLSGQSFPEFTAQGGTLAQAVRMIGEYAEMTGQSIFDMIPEARAAKGFQLLFDNLDTWAEHNREIADSAGAAAEAHDLMAATTQTALDRLGEGWQALKVNAGEATASVLGFLNLLQDPLTANDVRLEAAIEQWKNYDAQIQAVTESMKDFELGRPAAQHPLFRSEETNRENRLRELFETLKQTMPTLLSEFATWDDFAESTGYSYQKAARTLLEIEESGRELAAQTEAANVMYEEMMNSAAGFASETESLATTVSGMESYWQAVVEQAENHRLSLVAQAEAAAVLRQQIAAAAVAYAAIPTLSSGSIANINRSAGLDLAEVTRRLFEQELNLPSVPTLRTGGGGGGGGSGGGGGIPDVASDLDLARSAHARGGPVAALIAELKEHQAELEETSTAFLRVGDEIHRLETQVADAAVETERSMQDFAFELSSQTNADIQNRLDVLEARKEIAEEGTAEWRQIVSEMHDLGQAMRDNTVAVKQAAAADRARWRQQDIGALDADWDRFARGQLSAGQLRTLLQITMGTHGYSQVGLHARSMLRRLEEHLIVQARRMEDERFAQGLLDEAAYRRILEARVRQFGRLDLGVGTAAQQALDQLNRCRPEGSRPEGGRNTAGHAERASGSEPQERPGGSGVRSRR